MKKISENLTLKACRIIANIKAEEISDFVGVGVNTFYKWENGITAPKLPQMRKIVQCFAEKGYDVEMGEINFFKQ